MPDKILEPHIQRLAETLGAKAPSAEGDNPVSLFQGLEEASLQDLLSHSLLREIAQGQTILQQGDSVKYLYYIVNGKIKTFRAAPDGSEATIRMLQDRDTFMDAVIFMGGASPVGAAAVRDSTLLLIPADLIRKKILQDGQLASNLLRIVTRHYKTALQQIDGIVTKTPIERLGYYFLKLHIEQNPDSMDIDLPFQKSMIANHLGMTPETFSRALSKLKTMGINVDQERITLRDSYMLCHFCDPDTAAGCPRHGTDQCSSCGSF